MSTISVIWSLLFDFCFGTPRNYVEKGNSIHPCRLIVNWDKLYWDEKLVKFQLTDKMIRPKNKGTMTRLSSSIVSWVVRGIENLLLVWPCILRRRNLAMQKLLRKVAYPWKSLLFYQTTWLLVCWQAVRVHGRTGTTLCVPATQPMARLPADSYYQAHISLDEHIMLSYHAMQLQISTIFLGTNSKLSIASNGSFLSPLFQNQNKGRWDVFSRLNSRLGLPISHLLLWENLLCKE